MWNLKLIAAALIAIPTLLAGSAWYGYSKGRQSGILEVQTLWDSEKLVIQAAQAEEMMKARQREEALRQLTTKIRQEKQREAIKLAADYAAVIDSLQNRADRPSGGSLSEGADTGTGLATGCTGAQLYKPDAGFLAGEANTADKLRLALKACIAHTTEVERTVNKN
jgi:hypothetical protein